MKRKLQVFVSSTFTDLKNERQAAVSAILKSGHIPAGMELFTAGDKSQMETIKKWIDESDVYMLILAGRYGSVEPSTNLSYTELEYDYAVEQGKPVFAVIMGDDALEKKVQDGGGTALIEKENQKELKQFKEKVLTKMSSFFDDEKDIKLCVHESLSDFAQNRALKGWVSSDEIVDPTLLYEEIKALRDENASLKTELQKVRKPAQANGQDKTEEFTGLAKMLDGVEISIPDEVSGGKGASATLFNIMYTTRDKLVNGVTNSMGSNATSIFLYHNIAPKLTVHGLMENEKVAGVAYRRSFMTKKGLEFLAYCDRKLSDTDWTVTTEDVKKLPSKRAKRTPAK